MIGVVEVQDLLTHVYSEPGQSLQVSQCERSNTLREPRTDFSKQWEDPLRTLGSYFGTLGLLFGLHYFPLTQLALKGAATILGSSYSVSHNLCYGGD